MRGMGEKRTLDRIQCTLAILWIQVSHGLAHDQAELNFIVQVGSAGSKYGALTRQQHRRRGLEEEKGLLWLVAVEFCDMVAVLFLLLACFARG